MNRKLLAFLIIIVILAVMALWGYAYYSGGGECLLWAVGGVALGTWVFKTS
jgi:hypothetical protein